jgi:periplasmic divalent cation tolerance protein
MSDAPEGEAIVIALTTAPDDDAAALIARTLVGEGLAACVSRIPSVLSIYRFEGAVHEDREVMLVIKTTTKRLTALERRLLGLHPYEVPEFLVVEASAASDAYARWLRSVVA